MQEPINQVFGSNIKRFIIPIDILNLENLLAKLTPNKSGVLTVSLINSIYLKLSFQLLPSYLQGDNYILLATDITALKKKEFELLELHGQLKQQLVQLQDLRFDIINAKIETDLVNKRLENIIEKLVKENSKLKLTKTDLKLKLKQKIVNS